MEKNKIKELEVYNIHESDKDDYLWKYLSIEKVLSIILNSKLYFTRIDCFEDLQEGISLQLLLLNHHKNNLLKQPPFSELNSIYAIDMFPRETDLLSDHLKETQRLNFANCWHACKENVESVAMWNLYSKPNSVALNISFKDFYQQLQKSGVETKRKLESLTLGKVKYLNFQNPNELKQIEEEIENTSFIKDISFNHENEFRFVAKIEDYEIKPFSPRKGLSKYVQETEYKKRSQVYGVDISLNEFYKYNFEIVFHPKMEEWVKADLKTVLKSLDIPFNTRDSNLKIH